MLLPRMSIAAGRKCLPALAVQARKGGAGRHAHLTIDYLLPYYRTAYQYRATWSVISAW